MPCRLRAISARVALRCSSHRVGALSFLLITTSAVAFAIARRSQLRLQTIDGCSVDPECAGNVSDCFPCVDPVNRLPPLVRTELLRSHEAHASFLGPLSAFAGAGADQRPLKLGEPAEDGEHELAVRRRGVGPRVLDRAETGTGLSDGFEDVEQVPRGARQTI